MWCFFDESYPREGGVAAVVACLMRSETLQKLGAILYAAKRRHYGKRRAKDTHQELKGNALLSNYAFKMLHMHGHSTNLEVAKDILHSCQSLASPQNIQVFGAAIYGQKDVLKNIHEEKKLGFPIVEMLKRISCAAREMEPDRIVDLVFDESFTDTNIAISIQSFVAGVKLANVSQFPLVGVSHVSPGIQLADIGAYILGRRAAGDERFEPWLSRLRNMEWTGIVEGHHRLGIQRWDSDGTPLVRVRKKWA